MALNRNAQDQQRDRQAIFLGKTEPRAARPGRAAASSKIRPTGGQGCQPARLETKPFQTVDSAAVARPQRTRARCSSRWRPRVNIGCRNYLTQQLGGSYEASYSGVRTAGRCWTWRSRSSGLTCARKAACIFDAEVKDQAAYQPFLQTAVKEVQAQGGKFIVQGAKPEVLNGSPSPNIVSISQWPSKEDAVRWYNSEAMKPVKDAQAKYTVTRLSIVEGKAP